MTGYDELMAAYRRTLFRVFDPAGEFILRVEVHSLELEACHQRHGVRCSLFITAWNPGSDPKTDAVNHAAQARLEAEVRAAGYAMLPGRGDDPDSDWREDSLLVLGIDEAAARALGRTYDQLAVVFTGEDCIPRLLVLTPGTT